MHAIWQRTATGMIPADDKAQAIYARLKIGQYLRTEEPVRSRSPDQLRLYWALIAKAHDNQEWYATKEDLSDAVKCNLGHCYRVVRPNGDVIERAKSIAFDQMPQDQFNEFMDAATKLLAEQLGVTVESLSAEIDPLPPGTAASHTIMAG